MFIEATTAVVTRWGLPLLCAVFCLALVMMCHWAQRHGRTTSLDMQLFPPRLRFYSGPCAEETTAPTQRDGETAGVHHLPSPPASSPAPREVQRLQLLDGERS